MIVGGITTEGGTAQVPPAGPQGMSAYDVAVAEGFVGSRTQWLASLQGPGADPSSLNAAVSRANVSATNAGGFAATAGAAATAAAATLATLTSRLSAAITSAVGDLMDTLTAAVTSATAFATAAGQSASAAAGSATAASGAVASATTQASAASTSASASAGSASAASGSATAAAGSATASAASATTAQNWAMQTSGTVDGTNYSAKYHAQQAATSAQAAAAGGIIPGSPLTQGNFLAAGGGTTAVDGGRIGTAAHLDVGIVPGTVAAADDSRITGALQAARALAEVAGQGTAGQTVALQNIGALTPGQILALALTN